jgi:hypothetical protein
MRFLYEISCREGAMVFGCYEMSLWKVSRSCCILFWWDFLMRFRAFWPLLWHIFLRFHAFSHPTFLFDVCELGGSLAGKECNLGGGGWCKCECVGRQKGLCGRFGGVMYVIWRMFAFFGLSQFFRFLFLRVNCECNRPSFLPTVFYQASKYKTSSICGYSWHRSKASNKPSNLSTNLCACPAETYCVSGTLAAATPLKCTTGFYCAKGSTASALCPSGHYCPSPSSLVPCPAGFVSGIRVRR